MKQLAKSIDHINIVLEDLELVSKFFLSRFSDSGPLATAGRLDIRNSRTGKGGGALPQTTLPGDTTSLELLQFEHPRATPGAKPGRANTVGFRHLAFRVQDSVAEVAALRALGIKTLSGSRSTRRLRRSWYTSRDPRIFYWSLPSMGELKRAA
jgi:hypothetical protein